MSGAGGSWEERNAALWNAIDDYDEDEFVARVEAMAADAPDAGVALCERACAQDSTGHPDRAVPLYRAAIDAGLGGIRRRRATIQLASSLRNLGDPGEAVRLLTEEAGRGSDELDGAVRAFLALALVDVGREREAVAESLLALSRYLPRYNRSLARYASALRENKARDC